MGKFKEYILRLPASLVASMIVMMLAGIIFTLLLIGRLGSELPNVSHKTIHNSSIICEYKNCDNLSEYEVTGVNLRPNQYVGRGNFCNEHLDKGERLVKSEVYQRGGVYGSFAPYVIFGPVLILAALIMPILGNRYIERGKMQREREEKQAYDAEIKERGFTLEAAKAYYEACVEAGIKNLDSSVNKQRALILAQERPEFNFPDIENVYIKMYKIIEKPIIEAAEAKRNAEKKAELSGLRNIDRNRYKNEEHIASLTKRDKRVYILEGQLNAVLERINVLREGRKAAILASAIMAEASSEKERGWGTAAGIASGIAGPGAGAAVALDIMAENQAIKGRNQARKQTYMAGAIQDRLSTIDDLVALKKLEERLRNDITETKVKLTDESHDAQELFNSLELGKVLVSNSKSGASDVKVTVKATKEFPIPEIKKTVIDGALKANFILDGEPVGHAYLTFPLNGLGIGEEADLRGICIAAEKGKDYTVELVPNSLWVMEM